MLRLNLFTIVICGSGWMTRSRPPLLPETEQTYTGAGMTGQVLREEVTDLDPTTRILIIPRPSLSTADITTLSCLGQQCS